MNEKLIFYLHKKILNEEFINKNEYIIFDDVLDIESMEVLSLDILDINKIKNIIEPIYINKNSNLITLVKVIKCDLIRLENITSEKTLIINNFKIEILRLYNVFIFRLLGYKLLDNINVNKFIIDKKGEDYVYFDKWFQAYIVLNNRIFGYYFYFYQIDNDNHKLLSLLERRFTCAKFKIINNCSINRIYFIPSKLKYIDLYHKVENFLFSININILKDILV